MAGVFWSKNPAPLLPCPPVLKGKRPYAYQGAEASVENGRHQHER